MLRGLIDAVVLYPGDRRGEVRAELRGEIAALLQCTRPAKAAFRFWLVSPNLR